MPEIILSIVLFIAGALLEKETKGQVTNIIFYNDTAVSEGNTTGMPYVSCSTALNNPK